MNARKPKGFSYSKRFLALFLLLFSLTFLGFATVYYVKPTGNNSNTGLGTGDGEAWQTLYKASMTVAAGDIVNIMAGTYTANDNNAVLYMRASGASDSRIIWQNYEEEEVIFRGQPLGINFATQQYITVDGVTIGDALRSTATMSPGVDFVSSQHNIVQNCLISIMRMSAGSRGVYFRSTSHYNSLLNSTVEYCGQTEAEGNDEGDGVWVDGTHNLVQGCTLRYGGHNTLLIGGNYNIARDNIMYNTGWNRVMQTANQTETYRQLVEDNIIHDSGDYTDYGAPNPGIQIQASNTIWRRNRIYNAKGDSVNMHSGGDYESDNVHFYHNVVYNGGTDHHWYYSYGMCINETEPEVYENLCVVNNIFYANYKRDAINDIFLRSLTGNPNPTSDDITNVGNHWDNDGDPKFTDAPNGDFTIPGSSPCVGAGAWLVVITSASDTGTEFVVDDAGYFCDGWGIIAGDEIQLQGTTEPVGITDIDYDTNTITVDEAVTWVQNVTHIGLEYEGSNPDIGWYEYVPLGGGTNQADWPNIYINESVETGGDGSQADPYSDFSEINWDTGGDNSVQDYLDGTPATDVTVWLMRGEEWRQQFTVGYSGLEAYRILVGAYGTGADPIINGSDLKTTWTDETGNVWKQTGGTTTEPVALFIDGVRGLKVAALVDVDSGNDWYWEANDLYLYSTVDPDTLSDPGVEATRKNGVDLGTNSANYVTIDGLHITKCQNFGVYLADESNNNIIQNCTIEYTGLVGISCNDGAGNNTTGIQILNNIIRYNGQNGIYAGQRSYSWTIDGNTVYDNCKNQDEEAEDGGGGIKAGGNVGHLSGGHIIQNNISYSNGAAEPNGVGIWLDYCDSAEPSIVCYNKSYDNFAEGIVIENSSNNQAYYNLAWDNGQAGLYLVGSAANPSSGNEIYNNVFYSNVNGIEVRGVGEASVENNLIKNNISIDNSSRELRCRGGGENDGTNGSGNVYLNNCFGAEGGNFIEWGSEVYKTTYDDWETAYGGTTASVEADPHMIDPVNDDFRLNPHSLCINAGTAVGFLVDYLGLMIRHAPDIGAHENQANAIF